MASSMRCTGRSAASPRVGSATDLPCGRGRPDGALPELQHPDALGDLSRALRRLRLHQALLRGRSLQLSRSTRRRRRRRPGGGYDGAYRSCEASARARVLPVRCGGSCEAYRAGSPCAAGEASAPWRSLRSVITPRPGGQGMSWSGCMTSTLLAASDTSDRTEDPAGVSGLLRDLGKSVPHERRGCPGFAELGAIEA